MTACCVSGYRPLRDIRPDEATWPPVLAPDGPWEICDCREGDIVRRVRAMEAAAADVTIDDVADVFAGIVSRMNEPVGPTEKFQVDPIQIWRTPEPRCRTCPVPPVTDAPIAWSEQWHAYLCAECAALLAEERADG